MATAKQGTLAVLKADTEKAVLTIQDAQNTVVLMAHLANSHQVYAKLQEAKELLQANYRKQVEVFKAAALGGA